MEYNIFFDNHIDQAVLKNYMPKEIFAESKDLPLLSFLAYSKEDEGNPIGAAFFTVEDPTRLLWIEIGEDYYGTDLARTILQTAEEHLRNENVSGIFTALFGDYFSTFRGNSFLDKNDFEVVKQNKRQITYRKEHISTSPGVEALCKACEKLCENVVLLDRNKQRHKVPLMEHVGDIRTDKPEYTDAEHSFAYMKENYMAGFAVAVSRKPSEVFVADFCVANHPVGAEATKGLLAMLLNKCIDQKDLSFITRNEVQRNLLIQLIGDPDRDVPYWEYYKDLNGIGDDIDG